MRARPALSPWVPVDLRVPGRGRTGDGGLELGGVGSRPRLNPSPEVCLSGGPVGTPSKRPRRCVWTRRALGAGAGPAPCTCPHAAPQPYSRGSEEGAWVVVSEGLPAPVPSPSFLTHAGRPGGHGPALRLPTLPAHHALPSSRGSRVRPVCLGSQCVCAWQALRTVLGLPCGCARGHRQGALCGCPGTQCPFPRRGTACVRGRSHPPLSAWSTEARVHPSQASVRADLRQRLQPV